MAAPIGPPLTATTKLVDLVMIRFWRGSTLAHYELAHSAICSKGSDVTTARKILLRKMLYELGPGSFQIR